jgi:hypothetical protein
MLRWEVQRIRGDSFGTEVGVPPSPESSVNVCGSILLQSSSPYRRSWTFAVSLGHQGHQQVIQSRQLFKTTSNEHYRATSSPLDTCRAQMRKKLSHANEMPAEKLGSFATLDGQSIPSELITIRRDSPHPDAGVPSWIANTSQDSCPSSDCSPALEICRSQGIDGTRKRPYEHPGRGEPPPEVDGSFGRLACQALENNNERQNTCAHISLPVFRQHQVKGCALPPTLPPGIGLGQLRTSLHNSGRNYRLRFGTINCSSRLRCCNRCWHECRARLALATSRSLRRVVSRWVWEPTIMVCIHSTPTRTCVRDHGKRWGHGIYLTDVSRKAWIYCHPEESDRNPFLLLYEALIGDPVIEVEEEDRAASQRLLQKGLLAACYKCWTGWEWVDGGNTSPESSVKISGSHL